MVTQWGVHLRHLGNVITGFYRVDVAQYDGDVLKAASHTIILHFWPLIMVHAELIRFLPSHKAKWVVFHVATCRPIHSPFCLNEFTCHTVESPWRRGATKGIRLSLQYRLI
jgi:hypothetical protein